MRDVIVIVAMGRRWMGVWSSLLLQATVVVRSIRISRLF
jgi:hypothetical protein